MARGGKLRAFDTRLQPHSRCGHDAAVLALFADGPCTLRNIGSWRVKETDRIDAMATELRKLGAKVESGPDWIRVHPLAPGRMAPADIDTYDDHRMAMCFSLAAFGTVPVTHPRSGLRRQDLSRLFRRSCRGLLRT